MNDYDVKLLPVACSPFPTLTRKLFQQALITSQRFVRPRRQGSLSDRSNHVIGQRSFYNRGRKAIP